MSILVFEHSNTSGSIRLGETLRSCGHRLRVVRLHDGDRMPPDLDDVDGIVSCGGPQSAYDDSVAWIGPQMQLMREAHNVDMPIVGLCLGCQILARALGGTVQKRADGIEFGWYEVKLNAVGREDPIHAGLPWTSMMFHHHRDEVTHLPQGAKLLASSSKCKVQTWTAGLRTYGFQYHPEISPETIARWVAEESVLLRESNLTEDDLRAQTAKHYAAFERITQRMFEQIAILLMPVDRRYQGVVKDLHY